MIKPPENKNIYYADEALAQFAELLQNQAFSQIFVLVDENTHHHCLPILLQKVPVLSDFEILEIPAGEASKDVEVLQQLWLTLGDFAADRQSLLVNLGGGVVTDLGGFLAATYMRGIAFVNFPTSLLAMADASAGGKTGVNLAHFKNRVGAFADARLVGVCPMFLETLPRQELFSGFAEMLKHGLIRDADHFQKLSQLDPTTTLPLALIQQTIAIKQSVTEEDPLEQGLRKILNFGHTVGHALESCSWQLEQPLSHGHAVALGMQVELDLSVRHAGLSPEEAKQGQEVLAQWYAWPVWDCPAEEFKRYLKGDKKNQDGALRFSLLERLGQATYNVAVSVEEVLESLQNFTHLA